MPYELSKSVSFLCQQQGGKNRNKALTSRDTSRQICQSSRQQLASLAHSCVILTLHPTQERPKKASLMQRFWQVQYTPVFGQLGVLCRCFGTQCSRFMPQAVAFQLARLLASVRKQLCSHCFVMTCPHRGCLPVKHRGSTEVHICRWSNVLTYLTLHFFFLIESVGNINGENMAVIYLFLVFQGTFKLQPCSYCIRQD